MEWREFGSLIRHLRFELSETEMHKITQEELDRRCGFPIGTVGRLERGDMRRPEHGHLAALARELRLTQPERREFFLAANGIPTEEIFRYPGAPTPEEELQLLLQNRRAYPYPAFITDPYQDFIYIHQGFLSLFQIERLVLEHSRSYREGALPNLVYFLFHPETRIEALFAEPGDWFRLAVTAAQLFRRTSLWYRTRPYWDYLIYRMRNDDPRLGSNLRIFWLQAEMRRDWGEGPTCRCRLNHPVWGELDTMTIMSEEVTAYGPLFVVTYLPLNAATERAFAAMLEGVAEEDLWLPVGAWPESAKTALLPDHFPRPRRRRI